MRLPRFLRRLVAGRAGAKGADPFPLIDARVPTAVKGDGPSRRRLVRIPAGVHNRMKCRPGEWVDVVGEDRERTIVAGENPDGAPLRLIKSSETFHWQCSGRLRNLTVTVRNGRYPLHLDARGLNTNCEQEIENVVARHLGNDGARAYQLATHGQAASNSVWRSENGVGMGTSSGSRYRFRRSEFVGPRAGLAIHNNVDFQAGADLLVEHCRLASLSEESEAMALLVRSLGSGREDRLILCGCTFAGDLVVRAREWFPSDLDRQPAIHAEFAISGHGNRPFVTRVSDFGRALRIDSAARSGLSRVTVTGSAVPMLFGDVVTADGSGGLPGFAMGTADVSGVPVGRKADLLITSLGRRLGDCTGGNAKSLTVSVDGGTSVRIPFDADCTAMTNGAVLDKLNGVLGTAAVAFLDNPGERVRPRFSDEEQDLRNTSPVGIRMSQVLAYGADDRSVRLMTRADPVSRFAGVAWEDILPGECGRVKSSGHLPSSDLAYAGGAVPVLRIGGAHSIDPAEPGRLIVDGAQGLLPVIRPDAVQLAS